MSSSGLSRLPSLSASRWSGDPPSRSSSTATSTTSDGPRNPRYKTEICRNFKERSRCIYGDQCQFAHGRTDLRDVVRNTKYKTKLCQKYWISGYCAYGPRCNFLHDESVAKKLASMERIESKDIGGKPRSLSSSNSSPVSSSPEMEPQQPSQQTSISSSKHQKQLLPYPSIWPLN